MSPQKAKVREKADLTKAKVREKGNLTKADLKAPRQRAKGPKPRPKAKLKAKSTDAERNIARAKVESRLAWNRDLSQDFELRIGFRNAVKPMYIQVRC